MPNPIFAELPTTIFEAISRALARGVRVDQSRPGLSLTIPGPEPVRRKAAEAVLDGYVSISRPWPARRAAPGGRRTIIGAIKAWTPIGGAKVTITSGATEALAASLLALIRPGDEVVLFQPLYDSYLPIVRLAGGVPRLASLRPPHWRIDRAMLEAVFSPKTRVLVLNSPLNPAAVVFPHEDLALLAEFCVRP